MPAVDGEWTPNDPLSSARSALRIVSADARSLSFSSATCPIRNVHFSRGLPEAHVEFPFVVERNQAQVYVNRSIRGPQDP
jgi:hypothetical protein